MQIYERQYAELVEAIYLHGAKKHGRNGITRSLHGLQLKIQMHDNYFPLLECRKMYSAGVLGELAAFFRGPNHVKNFEHFGCNYWGQWADKDGSLRLDYGNAWLPDLYKLAFNIIKDPFGRRHIINGWVPKNVDKLSLPCCHYSYQFLVTPDGKLDMIWIQRSVDMMVGLPSDVVLAATWLIALAAEVKLQPGTITMQLGDCHIYDEHMENVAEYLAVVKSSKQTKSYPTYKYTQKGSNFYQFEPSWLEIEDYNPKQTIKFEVKS